ncbi:MAG: ABC transporter substrate-binding protein [Chloroflexi bacterium HGW-Chloroflexi-9]|nr:MAG: ABC transporter substrate-binding protein [Chloroflexi bacterium HGW-Chloroflexi-9]
MKRAALAAGVVAFALLVTACGDDAADPTATPTEATPSATVSVAATLPAFPLTVRDSSGASIVIEARPERIVSHSPAVTEILFAVGAGAQMIAVDEFSNYPPEAVGLQQVRYSDPDPEQGVALEPDLIIFGGRQQGSVEAFRALGLPVFLTAEAPTIEAVLDDIMLIGRISGHVAEAEVLVAELRGRINAIATKVADVTEGPTVFYELTDGLYTVAPESFIGGMLTLLKARNIAAGAETAYPQLTAEVVVERNPEVILLADGDFGVSLETLKERPGWAKIAAVESGRVVGVDPDISSRPGPRIVDALELFAKALYPDRFE